MKNDNCVTLVKSFLWRVMNIPESNVYVQDAHRLGTYTPGKQRPVIARLPESEPRKVNTNRLRDTRHFISSQMPPSKSERKPFVMPQ